MKKVSQQHGENPSWRGDKTLRHQQSSGCQTPLLSQHMVTKGIATFAGMQLPLQGAPQVLQLLEAYVAKIRVEISFRIPDTENVK